MAKPNVSQEEDIRLETTQSRVYNLLKRHKDLSERLTRDSDKMVYERLSREFDAARGSQTQEVCLKVEKWNDGMLAKLRERVHMELRRKADQGEGSIGSHSEERITYRVGNKVICLMEGARIGIQYETSFAGEPCEVYHCVLESKSFQEKMTVIEHTAPFFLPVRELENEFLASNAMTFIDFLGKLLQAYVDRREQVRLINELYGNQIEWLYHSLSYDAIEFELHGFDCKTMIRLRYSYHEELPDMVQVLAWPPTHQLKRQSTSQGRDEPGGRVHPVQLNYAEAAVRTLSLPQAFAEIVLQLPEALKQIFPPRS